MGPGAGPHRDSALNAPWRFRMSAVRPRPSRALEGAVDDGAVAGEAGRLDELVVPLDGELLRRLVDERLDERIEVARVEARRRVGETARDVQVADDLDAVVLGDLAGLRGLAIAAA